MLRSSGASRKVAFWLAVCAGLLAFCVQSGELGSSDTTHRLQMAHSLWTSEPAVFPNEYPEFGVHGRGGKLYGWYGIGQPLLLLPFDIVGTAISRLPIFSDYGSDTDPTVRNIFVTIAVNSLVNVLTALVCYRFLLLLGFNAGESAAGVLALLLCTTHLHYTQNMMENNYILLLTLTGFAFQYEWLKTGSRRALWIASGAFGLNLLTRLTTGMDLVAGALFLVLVLWFDQSEKTQFWSRSVEFCRVALPIYLFFLFCDRLYQFYRFGTWTTTYVQYSTQEQLRLNPSLPAGFPWSTPFHVGVLGPLISPEKSIFMFDPLILLTMLLVVVGWKRFSSTVKAYVAAVLFLLAVYICFYARYFEWSGNFAWGDRYISSVVEMAAFISVPLLLKHRALLARPVWFVGIFLIGASLVIQFASLAFWMPLEIYQGDDFGHPQWVIWLRFKNIAAFALGKMDAWGLNTDAMTYDQWDYQHITCWNFLPFVLRRIGDAPRWVVNVAFATWGAGIAGSVYSVWALLWSRSGRA